MTMINMVKLSEELGSMWQTGLDSLKVKHIKKKVWVLKHKTKVSSLNIFIFSSYYGTYSMCKPEESGESLWILIWTSHINQNLKN